MTKLTDHQLLVLRAAREERLRKQAWGDHESYLIRQPTRPSEVHYGPRYIYPARRTVEALARRGLLDGTTLTDAGREALAREEG